MQPQNNSSEIEVHTFINMITIVLKIYVNNVVWQNDDGNHYNDISADKAPKWSHCAFWDSFRWPWSKDFLIWSLCVQKYFSGMLEYHVSVHIFCKL